MMKTPAFSLDSKPLVLPQEMPRGVGCSRGRRRSLAAVLASVSLALGACGGDDAAVESPTTESTGPVVHEGAFDATMKGAWRMLGEGRFIEVGDKEIRVFQETNSICYSDPRALPGEILKGFTYRYVAAPGRVTADLYATAGSPSAYTLERLDKVPENCKKAPPTDPATVFKTMWEIFNLDYGFLKERHIDWPAKWASLQPKAAAARDDDALQAVLVEAIQDFNDDHVSLLRYQGDEAVFYTDASNSPTVQLLRRAYAAQSDVPSLGQFQMQWWERMTVSMSRRLVPGTETQALNGAMTWGMLPGNIGYIRLSRMEGYADEQNTAADLEAVRAQMDRVIAALADTKAIVFDIAVNTGGYDVVGAEVAGRFADKRRLAFTVQQHRPQGRKNQEWFVEPKGARQYLKPVYLLTTDFTVSAGDTFTLMMRELPHVTHIGQPTSGAMSNKLDKALPGGKFVVTLSNESYFDARGVLYEGRGIAPKVALQVFYPSDPASLYTGHEAAIGKIIEMIGG